MICQGEKIQIPKIQTCPDDRSGIPKPSQFVTGLGKYQKYGLGTDVKKQIISCQITKFTNVHIVHIFLDKGYIFRYYYFEKRRMICSKLLRSFCKSLLHVKLRRH